MTLLDAVATLPVQHIALSDGATVRYRQSGLASHSGAQAAPVIVLLHGIGSGSASWMRQLMAAQHQSVRVLAWDAPGYADSTPVAAAQPVAQDYAQRLGLWLDALGVHQAHIVGHSLGCIMAASFAKLQPQRVSQLTLLAPAQGYGQADPEVRSKKLSERLHAIQTLGPQALAQQRAPLLLSPQAHADEVQLATTMMSQLNLAGYTQATHLLCNAHIANDLQQLPCPVQVACGDQDTITPPAGCQALAIRIGAHYTALPGAGHLCAVQAAGVVNPLLGLEK
jgi:pimeloyl-ACP methyl ester carboxylesterase